MNPVDLQIDHKEDDISYRFWYHQFSWLNNHQYNHCLNPLNPKLDPYPVAVAWPLLPSSCGLRPLPVPAAAFAALPPGTISDRMMEFRVFFGGFLLNTALQNRKAGRSCLFNPLFPGIWRILCLGDIFNRTLPKPPVPIWLRRTLQACGFHACPVGKVAGGFGHHNLEIQR